MNAGGNARGASGASAPRRLRSHPQGTRRGAAAATPTGRHVTAAAVRSAAGRATWWRLPPTSNPPQSPWQPAARQPPAGGVRRQETWPTAAPLPSRGAAATRHCQHRLVARRRPARPRAAPSPSAQSRRHPPSPPPPRRACRCQAPGRCCRRCRRRPCVPACLCSAVVARPPPPARVVMDPRTWFGRPAAKVAPRVRLAAPVTFLQCRCLLTFFFFFRRVGVSLRYRLCAWSLS